jgi:hypothetical protein
VKTETMQREKTAGIMNSIKRINGKEEHDLLIATESSKVTGYFLNQPSKCLT